ncbi:hypothetical protein EVAR_33547_1 [Eumeta japonica]|uniref:Uncharacterized protein n=1 Tax=Eumeta variegata TaxID=151549 RepID=A0A4C1VKH6_EUMVA|nr:hypothetical protein EVAR_33547_1 [Eumeta japonica]
MELKSDFWITLQARYLPSEARRAPPTRSPAIDILAHFSELTRHCEKAGEGRRSDGGPLTNLQRTRYISQSFVYTTLLGAYSPYALRELSTTPTHITVSRSISTAEEAQPCLKA